MKENDLKSPREDTGFVMEVENGKIEEVQDKKRGTKQVISEIPIGPAILLVLVFFVACMSGSRFKEKMEDASPTGSENEMVFVTEAEITQTEQNRAGTAQKGKTERTEKAEGRRKPSAFCTSLYL